METWLKGGLFTTLIILIIDIITRVLFPIINTESFYILGFIVWGLHTLIHIPSILILELFLKQDQIIIDAKELFNLVKIYVIPLSLLIWFLIGSLIGLIIGKIKSKKQK